MDLSSALRRLITRRPVASVAAQALAEIAGGQIAQLPVSIRFWDGSTLPASTSPDGNGALPPTIVVRRPRAIAHVLHQRSQLGLARGFIDESLTLEGDLETVLTLRGQVTAAGLRPGDPIRLLKAAVRAAGPIVLRPPPIPEIEVVPVGRRHSIGRDRQVVRQHYDLSNEFYRLLLGPSMVYSCAYYADAGQSLDDAQERKLDLICRKLDLHPGERLLDLGCGWGSLVIHAAARYGVQATGVTLSEAQAELARERVREHGLSDRIEIRVADYRELTGGPFDKIASVGMYEHVGQAQMGRYVRTVVRLLRPGGLMLNHAIARLDSEPPGKTFISRYIFPDGELHPVAELIGSMEANGLEVRDLESLHEHYGLTLRAWLGNIRAQPAEAEALVGAQRVRSWELYLLGSALAFEDDDITVHQMLVTRLGAPHGLPLDRRTLLAPRASELVEPAD
jgi:cyclopropane-fatty-acyl-phospholipid synthase